jgi:hypothetical protein
MATFNREAAPRFKPREHNFTTFRARSLNAFAKGRADGMLAKLAAAQGLTLEEGLTTLQQSYPIPIPIGGFRPAQHPRQFDRAGEREIKGGTLAWQAGVVEELQKLMRPGPVSTLYSMPNRAEQWGASGSALVDKLITARLLAGDTGTHGYDDAAFFGTSKKIAPDDPNSLTYDNKYTLVLDANDPVSFVREVKRRMKKIPHPMSTTDAPQWIDQELSGFIVSTDNFEVLNDVAKDDDTVVVIKDGATPVAATTRSNQERGSFTVIESKSLTDNRIFAIARGPGADAAILVHTLIGIEELPGGDFMAPDAWQAETGTWMMPRIWELDKNSEFAKLNGQILIGADLDVDAILYAPWSVHMIVNE